MQQQAYITATMHIRIPTE
ncbi:DUF3113 family protein, partial [Staphylococcus aureus]